MVNSGLKGLSYAWYDTVCHRLQGDNFDVLFKYDVVWLIVLIILGHGIIIMINQYIFVVHYIFKAIREDKTSTFTEQTNYSALSQQHMNTPFIIIVFFIRQN